MTISLEDMHKLLNSLFEAITSGIILVSVNERQIMDINSAASIMLGLDKDEVIGKSCNEFICKSPNGSCPLLDKGVDINEQEGFIERKDGSIVTVLKTVTSIIFRDKRYLIINLIDITSCKRSEIDAKENEQRFRDIIHMMVDCVWELDLNCRYMYCSERVVELLGYTANEIIGKTPFDFMNEKESKRIKEIFFNKIKNKEKIVNLENWSMSKDGKRVCFLMNGVPVFDHHGNIKCYRGISQDITEKKLVWDDIEVQLNNNVLEIKNSSIKNGVENNILMRKLYNALNLDF